ncbi:MAG TPA: hypothetical protein VK465_06490 [Fibrobacteria bacterium]|nr:hypothetical protein [Fibrobacteria bacterium]
MPIHNAGSVPPRHATPPGTQPQYAKKYQTLHFRTEDFERSIQSLPADKQDFARRLFPKDATGKWMKTNQERLEAFTDILNPTERAALAKIIKERNPHLMPGRPVSEDAGSQARRPTPEPEPQASRPAAEAGSRAGRPAPETGATPVPGSRPADAPARPGRQATAGTEAHSNPTSHDGLEPEAEGGKRPMSLGKKIALGVLALITLPFLLTKVDDKNKETPRIPE